MLRLWRTSGVGILLPRREEIEPFEDKAYPCVDSVVSTFEEAWDGKESGGSCKEDGEVLVCTEPCSLEPEVFHVIEMRGAIEQRRGQRTPTTRP